MAPLTTIIKCKRYGGEPFARVKIRINRHDTFFMYIDTARLTTAISKRAQEILELPTTKRSIRAGKNQVLSVDRAVIDSFAVAGFPQTEVAPLVVYVTDVQFVDGRIGMNYLSQFLRVCYDFPGETLLLTR